jgi:hypothetical protein
MDVSKLPRVKSGVTEGIIGEVLAKNSEFGIKDFESSLNKDNPELAKSLYQFMDAVAITIANKDKALTEEICATYKIGCHLLYKSLIKQLEINAMEG